MATTNYTTDGTKGGVLGGKKHSEGGVKAVVVDTNKPVELEAGEVIITAPAVKKHWKELSEINQDGGGVPIHKPVGATAKDGGIITPNNNKFVITKKNIQDVISGKSKVSKEAAIKAASRYIEASQRASNENRDSNKTKQQEKQFLIQYAEKNNLLYTPIEKRHFSEGAEQRVYLSNDGETVIKLNDSIFYESWVDYFNNLLLHNYFFPDTAYTLIGFYIDGDKLYCAVKQKFIKETSETNLEDVKKLMLENGFNNTKNNDYYNPSLGIILEDLHEGNVLTQDGTLYFIDTVFYLKEKLKLGGAVDLALKQPHAMRNIAKKHGKKVSYLYKQLLVGEKVELEHTKDIKIARTIAKHHLWESPDYYKKLDKIENTFKGGGDVSSLNNESAIKTHVQYKSVVLETVGKNHYLRVNGESWKLTDIQLSELLLKIQHYENPYTVANYLYNTPKGEYDKVTVNKLENGGNVEEQKKKVDSIIDNLTEEQLSGIKEAYSKAILVEVGKEKEILDQLESERAALVEKNKEQQQLKNYKEAFSIREQIYGIDKKIRNANNKIFAIKNFGDTSSFTDKKGTQHNGIPTFSKISTEFISFNEDTILTDPLPKYIPFIDEEVFARKGYMFDAIRIGKDLYILATNGYKEHKQASIQEDIDGTTTVADDSEQGYVIVTLDQLALINDYYYKKAKATIEQKAQEVDKRQLEYYDKLPIERREKHLNQKGFYHSLPAVVRKKITQTEYEALTLEEKEKLYKPVAKGVRKRLVSKLEDNKMWTSFHEMYERFVNPLAVPINKDGTPAKERGFGTFGNPETFQYWYKFRYMMDWKIKDIAVQRQFESDIRSAAIETSFGDSNTDSALKEKYGILVKRQNGEKININEIEQIRTAWEKIGSVFGSLIGLAKDSNMKISHTGKTLVFASKAVGVYIPTMKTIAVSAKLGNNQFENIMAHEVAHWIDNTMGGTTGHRYISDDFESKAGIIADTLRRNMNEKSDSKYTNSTKECFARAMEQYYAIQTHGDGATVIANYTELDIERPYFLESDYVSKEVYNNKLKPLITEFLSENKDFFKYDIIPVEEAISPTEQIQQTEEKMETEKNKIDYLLTRQDSYKQGDFVAYKDVYGQFTKLGVVEKVIPPSPQTGEPLETYEVASAEYTSDELRKAKETYKYPIGSTVFHAGYDKEMLEVIGHEDYNSNFGWATKTKSKLDGSIKTFFENTLEPSTETPELKEKSVEQYKQDLNELISEELVKHEADPKSKTPLNEISKLLGIYWENIVSKHPTELTDFLLLQEKLPSKVRIMAEPALMKEWSENFRENLNVNVWSLIPEKFKEHSLPKRIAYNPNPEDTGLNKIVSDFVSHDELRLKLMGVYFDKNGIVATDANKMLFLSHPSDRKEAIYCITKDCLKSYDTSETTIIDDKYPNYVQVIPNNTNIVSIHTASLISYLKTVIQAKYFNPITKTVFVMFDSETEMAFNAEFLLTSAIAMYKLGYEQIDIGYSTPNRAIVMCKKGETKLVASLKTDFVLVMPVMIGGYAEFNNGTMYFNAESECVATKGISDKSCLSPIEIEKQKLEKVKNEISSELAAIRSEKESAKLEKEAQKIADNLMGIDATIQNKLKLERGSQLYSDIELQKKYKELLDDKIIGKFEFPLSQKVFDAIEDDNYHSLNQYLQMSGAYGQEKMEQAIIWTDSLKEESKENYLSTSPYKPDMPEIKESEISTKPTISVLKTRLKIVKKMLEKTPTTTLKTRVKIIEKMLLQPEKFCCGGEVKMKDGGNVPFDKAGYEKAIDNYDLLGAYLEDETDEEKRKELKQQMIEAHNEIYKYERPDNKKVGGNLNSEEEVDLFQTPELLPKKIQRILDKYGETGDYETSQKMLNELTKVGYTFEYGLDSEPYNLRKIEN